MRVRLPPGQPMFKNYIISYDAANTSHHCVLIDSEFQEKFIAHNHLTGVDIITPIIEIYEKKECNIAYNLVKLYSHLMTRFDMKISLKEYISNLSKVNPLFAKYEKDTEKYFVLL